MKESAKSDCRFGFLVENRYIRHTPDVSDVSDVTDVTDVTYVTCETSEDTFPIQNTVFHQDSESAIGFT